MLLKRNSAADELDQSKPVPFGDRRTLWSLTIVVLLDTASLRTIALLRRTFPRRRGTEAGLAVRAAGDREKGRKPAVTAARGHEAIVGQRTG